MYCVCMWYGQSLIFDRHKHIYYTKYYSDDCLMFTNPVDVASEIEQRIKRQLKGVAFILKCQFDSEIKKIIDRRRLRHDHYDETWQKKMIQKLKLVKRTEKWAGFWIDFASLDYDTFAFRRISKHSQIVSHIFSYSFRAHLFRLVISFFFSQRFVFIWTLVAANYKYSWHR